jgi:hypothetical protein
LSPCAEDIGCGSPNPSSKNSIAARGAGPSPVRRDDDGPPRPAQEVGDVAILLGKPCSRVDEKDDDVGLGDRLARLLRHLVQDAVLRDRLEPAGVHHQERPVADAAARVVAVAREPGVVGNERRAGPGQPIEERRLADVGTADDDEGREHGARSDEGCPAEAMG